MEIVPCCEAPEKETRGLDETATPVVPITGGALD